MNDNGDIKVGFLRGYKIEVKGRNDIICLRKLHFIFIVFIHLRFHVSNMHKNRQYNSLEMFDDKLLKLKHCKDHLVR